MITNKIRFLTLSLIFSGALNIGLLATCAFFTFQEKPLSQPFAKPVQKEVETTNGELFASMSRLSFRELVSILTNRDLVEEGYLKRDLAVAALVAFHHFNIEKALSAPPSQIRTVSFAEGQKIDMFPALTEEQFEAIIRFAYQEKWPLTAKGLFALLGSHDESLEQTFALTPEFGALQVLFQKTGAPQDKAILLNLVSEGSWDLLEKLAQEQAAALDFSIEKRRALLLSYLALQSSTAAQLLLRTDFAFALKKLEDSTILTLLAALKQKTDEGTKFCTELLRSPRSDPILQAAKKWAPAQPEKGVAAVPTSNRFHVVKERETLWKIARQYKVKVDELVRLNNLEKDSLFPGMTLKLPQGTGSEPPP